MRSSVRLVVSSYVVVLAGCSHATGSTRAPAAYRAGLGHADAIFAQTLAALDALDLPADTIFVVVGDHGEALGEHGTLSHGRFLHDEMVRVPMLVRAPGRLPAGRVVQGSCGLVDLAPTLLELAEASVPGAFDGRSVVPLAMGEAQGHPVIAEEDRTVVGAAAPRALRVVSVRTDAAKWMLTYDVRTRQVLGTELFDLATDPGETKPLVGVEPAHFGAVFCNAVAQARSRIPGQSAASPCEVAAR